MKALRNIIVLFVAIIISNNIFAYDFYKDGFYYDIIPGSNSVSVTHNLNSWSCLGNNIVIPSNVTYNGTSYSVTYIGEQAFRSTSLTSITIPNNVTSIESDTFYDCTALDTIICKANVPPYLRDYSFHGITQSDITLIVPCGKKNSYESAEWWSLFGNIVENCDNLGIEDITGNKEINLYPNPASETITIEAKEDVIIYNNLGQMVKQVRKPKGEITININDLPNGVYYLNVGEKKSKLIKE